MAINFEHPSEKRQFRLAGEDAPLWPAASFGLLGALLAFAAAAQFVAPRDDALAPFAPVEEAAPLQTMEAAPAADAADTGKMVVAPPAEPAQPVEAPAAAPAPAVAHESPAPTPAAPATPEPSACLPIVSIPFDLNSARLKSDGLDAAVTPLRAWLATHRDAVLSVEGHADATGPEAYNVVLSYKRAEAAAAWLARAGAPLERIAARAAGTRAPARQAANATSNRQVILQIEGVETCREDGAPARKP